MRELALGATLGLGAGVAPGPLMALLLSSTLTGGLRAGSRVAVSPIISDIPVVVLSLTVLSALPNRVTAILALAGAAYVCWLGIGTIRQARTAELSTSTTAAPSIRSALLVNLLNPHAWLFWISVGTPLLLSAWHTNPVFGTLFLAGFYTLFVGTKLTIALVVAGARGHINQTWYRRLLIATGLLLLATAALMAWEFLPLIPGRRPASQSLVQDHRAPLREGNDDRCGPRSHPLRLTPTATVARSQPGSEPPCYKLL